MRQSKAKEIRKFVKAVTTEDNVPVETKYEVQEVINKHGIMRKILRLGKCQRQLTKFLKKTYKENHGRDLTD